MQRERKKAMAAREWEPPNWREGRRVHCDRRASCGLEGPGVHRLLARLQRHEEGALGAVVVVGGDAVVETGLKWPPCQESGRRLASRQRTGRTSDCAGVVWRAGGWQARRAMDEQVAE